MNITTKAVLILVSGIALYGCASPEPDNSFDDSLYSGRPVDTLSPESDQRALTEAEAVARGDRAYTVGNLDLALFEYIQALSFVNGATKDTTLYKIGNIHLSRGNQELAEKAFQLSLKENPNNADVLQSLGLLYTRTGDHKQGKSYFFKAVNADLLRLQSPVTIQKTISADLVNALITDSESPEIAYSGLGVNYDLERNHKLAQVFYEKALTIKPDSVNTLNNMGYSKYMEGEYVSAQNYMIEALEIDPGNEKALNNLALTYVAKGEVTRALNIFKSQMSEPEALNNVGYLLILKDRPEQAVPYLQQAIDTQPTYYKVANENLERALTMIRAEGES